MGPTAEIKIKRYASGWVINANWANAEGERRAYAKFELGDAELPGEVATVVELIGRTAVPLEQVPAAMVLPPLPTVARDVLRGISAI